MAKATAKKTESVEATETVTDAVQGRMKSAMDTYFNTLADGSERMAQDFHNARARNTRIMDKLVETMENGRKDMLELSRAVAASPTDYKANLQLAMDTMNRRQECAIEFGKTVYREQSEMASEASERAQEMFAPLRNADIDWMAPYKNLTNFWTASAK